MSRMAADMNGRRSASQLILRLPLGGFGLFEPQRRPDFARIHSQNASDVGNVPQGNTPPLAPHCDRGALLPQRLRAKRRAAEPGDDGVNVHKQGMCARLPSRVNCRDITKVTKDGVTQRAGALILSPMPKKELPSELDAAAGRRLKAVREAFYAKGPIKQEEFAKKIGVGRTALANWESGKLPDVRAMVRLHEWLGIPLEWIYLGQTRHLGPELARRLEDRASDLGLKVRAPPGEKPPLPDRSEGRARAPSQRAA